MSVDTWDISEAKDNTTSVDETRELLSENQGNRWQWWKRYQTVCLGLALSTVGLKIGLLGVTFLDLLHMTGTDVRTGSFLFVVTGLGSMLGSVVAGFLCDRDYAHVTLTTSLMITGVFAALLPWSTSFVLQLLINIFASLGMGLTETVVPFLVIQLWEEEHPAYTQVAYFCFSAGGILAPVIAEPFLNPLLTTALSASNVSTVQICQDNLTSHVNVTDDGVHDNGESLIHIPFFIAGFIALFSAVVWTTAYCVDRNRNSNNTANSSEKENNSHENDSIEFKGYVRFCFLTLVAVFFMVYDSVEDGFQNFVTTILVDSMSWSKSDGAKATSVFWGCYTGGKIIGFYLARVVKPFKLAFGYFVGLNSVWVLLSWFLEDQSVLSWILLALLGLFMAPLYPISISMANTYLSSGMVSSIIITSSDLGCLLNPVVIGHLLQYSVDPLAGIYAFLIASMLSAFVMVLLRVHVWFFYKDTHVSKEYQKLL